LLELPPGLAQKMEKDELNLIYVKRLNFGEI